MPESIGVVVAHDDRAVVEAVAEALESEPGLFVVATSPGAGAGQVLVAGGQALAALRATARPLVALAGDDAIRAARAALAAGARDIVRWPEEAARLPSAIREAAATPASAASGRVVAVAGARGGAGTTLVAAALASALGDALVLDLDVFGAGQRGLAPEEPIRTIEDLRPSLADCARDALEAAVAPHAGGSRALHAVPGSAPLAPPAVHGLLRAARGLARWVIVDHGRAADPGALAGLAAADERVVVLANDVASIRGARALADRTGPCRFAVRRARRAGVPFRDIAAAVGSQPFAVPEDRALARAADLGALPSRHTRALRAVARIARALEEAARG